MDTIKIIKTVTSLTVAFGTSNAIHGVIQNNAVQESTFQKVTVYASKFVVAMMINEMTRNYTDAKIDAVVAAVKLAKAKA